MNIDYRINYFKQIKDFYSLIFNTDYEVRPVHISLYMFLLNQNNRNNWVEWFKCPFDLAMAGACINSKNTYYKTLDDLQFFNLIEYEKGINLFKAPKIKILPIKEVSSVLNNDTLTEQVSVPQSEPQTEQQTEPLSVLLNKNIYKLITNNFKTINLKQKEVISFLSNLENKDENNIEPINWPVLLDFFNKTTGKECKVVPKKAKEQFNARLKEGFTKVDIANAIVNASNDDYHIKEKLKYITLEFISRADKLDKFSQVNNFIDSGTTNQKLMKYDDSGQIL